MIARSSVLSLVFRYGRNHWETARVLYEYARVLMTLRLHADAAREMARAADGLATARGAGDKRASEAATLAREWAQEGLDGHSSIRGRSRSRGRGPIL